MNKVEHKKKSAKKLQRHLHNVFKTLYIVFEALKALKTIIDFFQ